MTARHLPFTAAKLGHQSARWVTDRYRTGATCAVTVELREDGSTYSRCPECAGTPSTQLHRLTGYGWSDRFTCAPCDAVWHVDVEVASGIVTRSQR